MIPKIIHYCWLSGDPYPELIKECLETWDKHLSDYEIWLWDKKRFDIESTAWTKEAYQCKKYAFAADYIRLYALYNYGGIYLDSDVTVYKSFDDLLDRPYFIGEDYLHCFEPAIIGAEKGCGWIKDVLDYYDNRHFFENDKMEMCGLPSVFYKQLTPIYRFLKLPNNQFKIVKEGVISVFPSDFFNARDYVGVAPTSNSYCAHNYLGSWLKSPSRMKKIIRMVTPRRCANLFYKIRLRTPSPVAISYEQ